MNGRFQSKTKALIITIQEMVVHTNSYGHKILKDNINPKCSSCKSEAETIGYLLSSCNDLNWTFHKDRHDRVLYQLLIAFCKRYDLELLDSLKWRTGGWNGVGAVESKEVKLAVDFSIPTDCSIMERRPSRSSG